MKTAASTALKKARPVVLALAATWSLPAHCSNTIIMRHYDAHTGQQTTKNNNSRRMWSGLQQGGAVHAPDAELRLMAAKLVPT
jgi:hypothetical protein